MPTPSGGAAGRLDYHVELYGHFYSVPYRLMREVIEARITDQTIELFHQNNRVACHVRDPRQHRHTTIAEHMPSAHRRHAEWTPTRLLREAEAIGPSTIALVERIMAAKPHPEQGFPRLSGHPAPRAQLRPGAAGGGLPARHRHRRPDLRLGAVDPAQRLGSGLPP